MRCSSLRPFFASIHVTLTAHLSDFHPPKKVSGFWKSPATSNKNEKFPSLSLDYNMDRLTSRQTVHDLNPTCDVELTNNNNNNNNNKKNTQMWWTSETVLIIQWIKICSITFTISIANLAKEYTTSVKTRVRLFSDVHFPPKKSAPEVLKQLKVQVQLLLFFFFKCQWQSFTCCCLKVETNPSRIWSAV